MRTCLTLFCALALLASLYFLAYLEAEHLLGCPDAVYQAVNPWLPLVMIVCFSVVTLLLPWVVGLFGGEDSRF